ncbi:MAG: hypothetical protein JWO56_3085, partial [Acidobacteria bacterium]|nr:hypothetical protein [Acidobacteriota bacterium]
HGDAWLAVTDANEARFASVIDAYLGNAAREPRTGGSTDYLGALREVERLTQPLSFPPAVVFMTDGKYEPNPLFTPDYDMEGRRRYAPAVFEQHRELIAQALDGRLRLLDSTGRQPAPIFSGIAGGMARFTDSELAERSLKVGELRAELLERRYDGRGMEWSVIFLHPQSAAASEAANARSLLAGDSTPAGAENTSFTDCARPSDMIGAYIQTVSHWFGLNARQLQASITSVQVPSETEAVAVHVKTDPSTTKVDLICHSVATPLTGRDGEWAGVVANPGDCRVSMDAGTLLGGMLYFKPRFDWVLLRPVSIEVGPDAVEVPIEVQLYSLKERRAVDANARFPRLPPELPLKLRSLSGKWASDSKLLRVHDVSQGEPVAYRAVIAARDLPMERLGVEVDLSSMKEYGVTTRLDPLRGPIKVGASVAAVFSDQANQPTAIHVSGIPVHGRKVAGWIRRLLDE